MSLGEQYQRLKEEHGHENFSIVVPTFRLNLADPDQRALYDWLQDLRDRQVPWGKALARAFAGHLRDPKKSADIAEHFQSLEEQLSRIRELIESGERVVPRKNDNGNEISPKLQSGIKSRIQSLSEQF